MEGQWRERDSFHLPLRSRRSPGPPPPPSPQRRLRSCCLRFLASISLASCHQICLPTSCPLSPSPPPSLFSLACSGTAAAEVLRPRVGSCVVVLCRCLVSLSCVVWPSWRVSPLLCLQQPRECVCVSLSVLRCVFVCVSLSPCLSVSLSLSLSLLARGVHDLGATEGARMAPYIHPRGG